MLLTIVIFSISILIAFGMLAFRAWEIRTARVSLPENLEAKLSNLSFRHVEKNMLYLTKHIVQNVVLVVAKSWFIVTTKVKKFTADKLPKVYNFFIKKPKVDTEKPARLSFVQKAVLESKSKIRRIKEKVKKDHEEEKEVV